MGLLSEEIPSFEELINENELPPLNLKLMLDRVSSLPLYDRLNIDKGSFCEKETKLMQLQAEEYNDKINNLIKDKELETKTDDFIKLESEYLKSEESLDLFLKHFYNCLDKDELIKRIQRNMTFDEVLQESTDEVPCNNEFEPYTPSKEFLQFFLNANNGKYDNLFIPEPSHDLSSDFDSDDEVEIREEKIKELSHKLKFSNSSNSKFLEPIINANKPNAFEILPECSNKIPTLKKEDLFLSDSESENDLKTKNLVFAVDKTSDKVLQYQTKNGVKVLKKKKEKCDTTDSKRHLKNNVEPKSGVKKSNANIQRNHSNNPNLDQHKLSLDNVTTSAAGTNVVGSPKLLTNTNENVKKGIIKKQMKNETSSSGDEDWEGLAQKNLLLRSKNLEQKATKKK